MEKILLVDDDKNILNALRRELRPYYEIQAFSNPVLALECCREAQFDLVISDYKMPEMNGLEFLRQFAPLQPDALCIVLSGEADMAALNRTIKETHVYRFIAKPWDSTDLLSGIQQALANRDAMLESRRKADAIRAYQSNSDVMGITSYRINLVESDTRL